MTDQQNKIVPLPLAEFLALKADAERLRWLIANCTYMEHRVGGKLPTDKGVIGGYFPQTNDDLGAFDADLVGLNLDEYLRAVIREK